MSANRIRPFVRGKSCYRVIATTKDGLLLSDQRGIRQVIKEEKLNKILTRFKAERN